jgi:predicted TIM-barrel fold metal-dependent hydrolase
LRLPNVDAVLEGQIAAAGGQFRGIRQIAAYDPAIISGSSYVPTAALMDEPAFRRGMKRLPTHNLTFEAWIYHPQIKTLTEVARECPETKIVLNHFGGPLGVGPYKRDEVFPTWRADIKALSRCPNVYVKLGGLAMIVNAFDFHLAPVPPSSGEMADAWRPYVEACIEDFGANRCMFESNFPVDKGACGYPVLFNAFKRLAAGASASEKTDLFAGTASRFYRLSI